MLERRKAAGEYPEADLVFVSPMRRCLETAEVLYPGQEPVVIEEFRECDFGLFEGKLSGIDGECPLSGMD